MKSYKIILIILIINLVACIEQKIQQVSSEQTPVAVHCVFLNLQTAPGWICDEPVAGLDIQAVGMAEKSAAGQNYMKDMARIDALGHLAEKLKVKINKRVKQYIDTVEGTNAEIFDVSSSEKEITNKALENIKNYKSLIGPEGRIYVLVGMDAMTTKALVEKMVKISIKNEQVL